MPDVGRPAPRLAAAAVPYAVDHGLADLDEGVADLLVLEDRLRGGVGLRESFLFGRISAPFPPAVAHRLLLKSLTAAIE